MNRTEDDTAKIDNASTRKITVILLLGLPASGKSTLAQRLMDALDDGEAIYIEYDAIEDGIASQQGLLSSSIDASSEEDDHIPEQRRIAWNQARQTATQQLQEALEAASHTTSAATTTILMDDNFHLRGMRKQIHRLALQYKPLQFGIVFVNCPVEACLSRNQKRERRVPNQTIETMATTLEPPRVAWEADSTLEVHEDTPFQEILQFVQNCPDIVDLPDEEVDEEQQAMDRAKTLANEIHVLDNTLRAWVGQVAKADKRFAKSANAARKELLQGMKNESLVVSTDNKEELKERFITMVVPDSNQDTDAELLRDKLTDILTL